MNTKQYLQGYSINLELIKTYSRLRKQAQAYINKSLQADPAARSKEHSKLYKQLTDIIKNCSDKEKVYIKKCNEIKAAIDSLEDPAEKTVLQMRYLQERPATWEVIAERIHYSARNCPRIHNRAIKNIKL